MSTIETIDEVIDKLEDIVQNSMVNNDPAGYFASLYQKVTIRVKEGIQEGFFDDGPRMEKLDVIFAKRYIDAYEAYKADLPVTTSWIRAFDLAQNYWPIVLQHLLIGMNAHINLDLGVAAAEISKGKEIEELKNDFDRINGVLSSLVQEVQNDLASIWPTFQKIVKWAKDVDDFLIDFSMELARDGAWDFAVKLSETPEEEFQNAITIRDHKVSKKSEIISNSGWLTRIIFGIIRLFEIGTVAQKIKKLQD